MEAAGSRTTEDEYDGAVHRMFSVVGTGRMASALVPALVSAGLELDRIYSRTKSKAVTLARQFECGTPAAISESTHVGSEILFLLVSDDVIAEVAEKFARKRERWDDVVVLHTSGVHASSILTPFRSLGAGTGSMHPIQTVSDAANEEVFRNVPIMVEGDASRIASRIARLLGAIPHVIGVDDKVRVHTAAVLASNYLTVLIELANSLLSDAGIPPEILHGLAQQALENSLRMGPSEALTGPIVRGDAISLQKQLNFLTINRPDLVDVFDALSDQTLHLAVSSGRINAADARAIEEVLDLKRTHGEPGSEDKHSESTNQF